MPDLAPSLVVPVSTGLAAVGVLVGCVEDLSIPSRLFRRNVYDWRYCLAFQPHRLRLSAASCDVIFGSGAFRLVSITRAAAITMAAVTSVFESYFVPYLVGSALLAHLYLMYRLPYSLDGADQMILIVLAGILVMSFAQGNPCYLRLGAAFVTIQVIIAYATASLAKALGVSWRSGKGPAGIASTIMFGNTALSRWLQATSTARVAAALTMLGLGGAALGIAMGGVVAWAAVALAMAFHIGVAVLMDLNLFVWAFGAAMPAVLYMADWSNRIALTMCF